MMEQLLTEEDRPTAIYCANDISAVDMLKCMANNKKCGYMPSIIGNDDIEAAQDTKRFIVHNSFTISTKFYYNRFV